MSCDNDEVVADIGQMSEENLPVLRIQVASLELKIQYLKYFIEQVTVISQL